MPEVVTVIFDAESYKEEKYTDRHKTKIQKS